ncbi:glycoside hydrolase family 5 protein [Hypoxylon rubiginosum]|uniref:Glycoside hydrolase family 5 protein n=1 Tax=Hypoxylon rubiginosum TaxID=110542 RepID=A0ACB9ZCQ5_9PEZI|nr:glycoside hydrolase family 5 protein [Hypoxylon rubiginosum]
MRFVDLLVGAAAISGALAVPTKTRKRADAFQFTGVSESGAEFGNLALPGQLGKDYTWPDHNAISTLIQKGFNTFRIPIMMERFIPTKLTGTVNETYAAGLDDIVTFITGQGAYAVIDPHNFGRYYSNIITDVAGFGAWWTVVAKRYATNEKVIFDTNNEFHDEDNTLVGQLNQAAIDAIRGAGATSQYIFVEGNSWTGAWHWTSSGTAEAMGKLTDPQDKIVYEMHQYLDTDGSGTSPNCVSATIGAERLAEATAWLKANGKKGLIGETAGGANAQCIQAVKGLLAHMQQNSDVWTGWLWWGAGPWWADYMYGMEPPTGTAYTGVLPSLTEFI